MPVATRRRLLYSSAFAALAYVDPRRRSGEGSDGPDRRLRAEADKLADELDTPRNLLHKGMQWRGYHDAKTDAQVRKVTGP